MRCPACKQAVSESLAECPCGFSLAKLDAMLGMPPLMSPGITDFAETLLGREKRAVQYEIDRLERRFPQTGFSIVLMDAPSKVPLGLYAFWLFNRTSLISAVERGGNNRHVLLLVDLSASRAACIIGYGLEPFIGDAAIENTLNAARADFTSGKLCHGIMAFLKEWECLLVDTAESMAQIFGIGDYEFTSLADLEAWENESAATY